MDSEKIEAVLDWPEPQSIKDVQAFLGLANFNRRFIKNYLRIAVLLTDLTKKSDTAFAMIEKARSAFNLLKETFTIVPLLTIFNPDLQIILETNAFDRVIATAITQVCNDGKTRSVAYYSRKIIGLELNYNVYNKELLAIVEAFRYQRVYLEGLKHTVKVYSDYKNLLYWNTTKQLNRRQVRQAEVLAMYNFQIFYVKGIENGRADALSRRLDYMKDLKPNPFTILKQEGKYLIYA